MKKYLMLIGVLLFVSSGAFAQEYAVNDAVPYLWDSPGTQITTLTSGGWDDGYYDLAVPTANQFYYYGRKVTHLRISTNGYVVLGFGSASGDGADYTNDSIPNGTDPNAMVAPWWDDWYLYTTGQMYVNVVTQGAGSNNWITVSWIGVPHIGDATSSYSFQIIFMGDYNAAPLGYRQNSIVFNYADVTSGSGAYDAGASGTVGIEHYSGYQGEEYSVNAPSLADGQTIMFTPFVPIYDTTKDMAMYTSGQTDADLALFRPSDGYWYSYNWGSGSAEQPIQWGARGDVPLPGDFDADGDADEAVYRPSNSTFYCWDPFFARPWGTVGDIPMVADFNYDGRSDIAVFRPSNGYWYISYTGGGTAVVQWGAQGDIPVPADYDGDGYADLTVYRPSNGHWYIRRSTNPGSPWVYGWGAEGDVPFPVTIIGLASSDIAVFRPSTGYWYWHQTGSSSWGSTQWGSAEDHPVGADINAGTVTDMIAYRGREGIWYVQGWGVYPWGTLGDKPRCRLSFQIVAPVPSVGADTVR